MSTDKNELAMRSIGVQGEDIIVAGDVSTIKQLSSVPSEYINQDEKQRPLQHVDAEGNIYTYALNPLQYSVYLILALELLERFSFYGLYMTQTNYLTGEYDENWNAELTSMDAASLVSLSTAVAYTVPFIGGMIADSYLGDYKTILLGVAMFYLPGLFVIASSTAPNWLLGGNEFNISAYKIALLILWPVGTGIVKAVVNVFGARQYHPILQRSMVESFYVQFYMVINVGAVAGCIVVPIAARSSITVAYTIPFVLLLVAVLVFVAGSKRYVIRIPHASETEIVSVDEETTCAVVDSKQPNFRDVALIMALIIPFNIVYNQCPTTFMVQGAVMEPFLGFIEAPSLNILDSVSVLVAGFIVSSYLYPFLAKNNIKLATGYKFALGSAIGVAAILWSLLVEKWIHEEYIQSGGKLNVVWQAPSYVLIGMGEIFSISTAYEVAFTASPPNKKAFACAFNLFCIGGIPNMLSLGLFRLCEQWFQNDSGSGNIGRIHDYAEAHVAKYFWLLFVVASLGVGVNLLQPVKNWISSVENIAAKASSQSGTPKSSRDKRGTEQKKETDLLLPTKTHIKYLEKGEGPLIYRMNTTKAEFTMKKSRKR